MEFISNNPAAAVLLFIIAVLLVVIILLVFNRPKTVTITDDAPASLRTRDAWLKLQNEGAKYIVRKDGKVYLTIVRRS